MYTHAMLILINRRLLNVAFSMTKTLNSQRSPKQNLIFPAFQCYLENPASLNACFSLFHTPFFISNFKFHLTPLQLLFCGLWANEI